MGASSGAMLTEALMAVYPDVFKAGAEFSGVPAGCWSDGWSAASNWGGTCANGQDIQTAQAWGALVAGMYPGYTGYRPRLQLWHGTADATINFQNELEAIKEWTNVLGLNTAPNSNVTSSIGGNSYTVETWNNTCGYSVLVAYEEAGGGHTTPIDSSAVISFFGLDKPTGLDPEVAQCGGDAGVDAGTDAAHDSAADSASADTGSTDTGSAAETKPIDTGSQIDTATTTNTGHDSAAIDTGTETPTAPADTALSQDSASVPPIDSAKQDSNTLDDSSAPGTDASTGTAAGKTGCSCQLAPRASSNAYFLLALLALVHRRRASRKQTA
jgi:hypothetical protein